KPAGIVAAVCEQRPGLQDLRERRPCADVAGGLASRQKHPDRATPGIGQDAQLRSSARLWCTRSAVRAPFELSGPPARDLRKRAGMSIVLRKASAVTGPTPGIDISRRQTESSLTISVTLRCSWEKASRTFRLAVDKTLNTSSRSGRASLRSFTRASN